MANLKMKTEIEAELDWETRDRLARLAGWPLGEVARRAALEYGWVLSKRRSVERAYRQFLALIAINPGCDYGMTQGDVDQFWHHHILDTVDYHAMCQSVFGRMVHHCPVLTRRLAQPTMQLYTETTLPALRRTFGVRAGTVWPDGRATDSYSKCCGHIEAPDARLAA